MKNYDEILRELSYSEAKKRYRWDVYAENTYCPFVKITNWWYHREGYPKDYDNVHNPNLSSYKRWGISKEDKSHWISESKDAMENELKNQKLVKLIKESQPHKMLTFLNYHKTEKTRKDLLRDEIRMLLPSLPSEFMKLRYTTTNKTYYKWYTN